MSETLIWLFLGIAALANIGAGVLLYLTAKIQKRLSQ